MYATGKKTADVHTIKRRFKSLGVSAPWKRFDRFSRERNKIEHYYTQAGREAIEALLADACLIIDEFVAAAFDEGPWHVLEADCYQALRKIEESAREKRKAHLESLKQLKSLHPVLLDIAAGLCCERCGTPQLQVMEGEAALRCDLCTTKEETIKIDLADEDLVERELIDHYAYLRYRAARMKCGDPVLHCPECMREALLTTEVTSDPVCLACGYEPDGPLPEFDADW